MFSIKNTRKVNIISNLLLVGLLLSTVVVGMFFYWNTIDNNFNTPSDLYPITYTYVVPHGGSFQAKYFSQRFRNCFYTTQRTIRDEKSGQILLQEQKSNRFEKETTSTVRDVKIELPPNMQDGIYSYTSNVKYYCNPSNNLFGPITRLPVNILFTIKNSAKDYEWVNYDDSSSAKSG